MRFSSRARRKTKLDLVHQRSVPQSLSRFCSSKLNYSSSALCTRQNSVSSKQYLNTLRRLLRVHWRVFIHWKEREKGGGGDGDSFLHPNSFLGCLCVYVRSSVCSSAPAWVYQMPSTAASAPKDSFYPPTPPPLHLPSRISLDVRITHTFQP